MDMFEGLPDDMPDDIKRKLFETLMSAQAHQVVEQCMAQMDGAAYALGAVGGFFSVTELDTPGYKDAMLDVVKAAAGLNIDEWPEVLRPGGKRNIMLFMERKHDYFFKRFRARREKKPLPPEPCFHCGGKKHDDTETECPVISAPHREMTDGDDIASAEELNLRFGYL